MKLLNLFQGTINVVEGWMERGGGSGENLKEDEEEEVVVDCGSHERREGVLIGGVSCIIIQHSTFTTKPGKSKTQMLIVDTWYQY